MQIGEIERRGGEVVRWRAHLAQNTHDTTHTCYTTHTNTTHTCNTTLHTEKVGDIEGERERGIETHEL